MNLIERLQLLERCDGLIRRKATGKPKAFAKRLGVSKSTLYETLNLMRAMGGPIAYCNSRGCYFYTYETVFHFGFKSDFSGRNFSNPSFSD